MSEPHIRVTPVVEDAARADRRIDGENLQTVEQQFLDYFGLNVQPFGVTPNPRFLYFGNTHRQALAALTYGTELNRGFLTLIGKPGMGKTSLLFHYLDSLRNNARTAFLFQTAGNARDLMCYLLADLGLDSAGKDLPEMHSILNHMLMEEMHASRRFVLIIDEAQNLDENVLESIRLLSNFETPWTKLMQIVLTGQPQLAERLAKPSMAQLRQRVSLSIRIEPLTREEVGAYIDHRLWVAGHTGPSLFTVGARALVAQFSEGIPRNINNLCFCAMSLGWATKQKTIDQKMLHDVLADLNLSPQNGNANLAPTSADKSTQSQSQDRLPAVLTVRGSAPRSWLPRAIVASLVLITLGWAGVHFFAEKQIAFPMRAYSRADKGSPTPTLTPTSPALTIPADLNHTSPNLSQELPTKRKNPAVSGESVTGIQISTQASNRNAP